MRRPYLNFTIVQLEELFDSSSSSIDTLSLLEQELVHRATKRAVILLENVVRQWSQLRTRTNDTVDSKSRQRSCFQTGDGALSMTRDGNILIHNVVQGTAEWLAIRRGIPTASQFCKIITSSGQASSQADAYLETLITELTMGECCGSFAGNDWTERGKELEPEAVRAYERHMRVKSDRVGFITDRDRTVGCSPDRLVGKEGLLEVKCPAPHTHAKYLRDQRIDMRYYPQVQGQMFVTGRRWVDFFSYHPDHPHLCLRIMRDEPYLARLGELLRMFRRQLVERRRSMGAPSGAQRHSTAPIW
jgi:hypothetical protein